MKTTKEEKEGVPGEEEEEDLKKDKKIIKNSSNLKKFDSL